VGRRTNYGFEKRQRELKKQKKKEAKAERKRLKKEEEEGALVEGAVAEGLDEAVEAVESADVGEVEAEERMVE
jgi:hypothetical protein